jgi:hypothetical protein
MIVDQIRRRILAGVRPFDAVTRERLTGRFEITAPRVRWIRNRSGDFVVASAPGLDAHTAAPDLPPNVPPPESVEIDATVRDRDRVFLTRRLRLGVPRESALDQADEIESIFQPVPCLMFRAPHASVSPNWAVLRVRVADEAGTGLLAGALLRLVRDADDVLLGVGLTDERGEALVAASGIPVTSFSESADDAVIVFDVPARLDVVHDPDAVLPDTDDLENRSAELLVRSADVSLASGRHEQLSL